MPLAPTDSGVRLGLGVPKAGKSYTAIVDVHDAVRGGLPTIVIDPMHEWAGVPPDLAPLAARRATVAEAEELIATGKRRLVVVSPVDMAAEMDAACVWVTGDPRAVQNGRALRGLCIHEAWLGAGRTTLTPGMQRLSRAWRHTCSAAWLDAQRLSMLSRDVTELATELRLFAMVGDRDFAVVKEVGGRELVDAVRECGNRLSKGERGWHVALSESRQPPYVPVRRQLGAK